MSIKKVILVIGVLLLCSCTMHTSAKNFNFNPQDPYFKHILIDSKNNPILTISYRGELSNKPLDPYHPAKPNRILQFDSSGNFLKERVDLKVLPAGGPDFIDSDSNFWAAQASEDKNTIYRLDKENILSTIAVAKTFTSYFVTPGGALFFLRTTPEKATIYRYNAETRQEEPLFTITELQSKTDPTGCAGTEHKSEIFIVVDSSGSKIVVLITRKYTAEVRIYNPEGKLLTSWLVSPDPITPDSYISDIYIDANNLLYITHSSRSLQNAQAALRNVDVEAYMENTQMPTAWQKGSIAQFDLAGKFYVRIKEQMGIPGPIAVDKRGYLYVTMMPTAGINVYDKKGNFMFRWNALPPEGSVTWTQRREFEDPTKNLNENSSEDILVHALIYGDEKAQRKARQFLLKREPAVLLSLIDALKKNPENNNLTYLAKQITNIHGEKALSILKNTFMKEDEQGQQALAPLMARLTKDRIPEVTKLVNKMVREQNMSAGAVIENMPMEEATVKSYIDWLSKPESVWERNRLFHLQLAEHINDAFPALKTILLDPNNTMRETARAFVIGGQYFGEPPCPEAYQEHTFYAGWLIGLNRPYNIALRRIPQALQELLVFSNSNDIFIRDTAVVTLELNGFPGYEKQALEAAHRNPSLQQAVITGLLYNSDNNKDRIKSFIPEFLTILDESVNAITPGQKSFRDEKARQAGKEGRLARMRFDKMINQFVQLDNAEINKRLLHYVTVPDIPDNVKEMILTALNKDSLAYLAPDTIKLLDLNMSVRLLTLVVQNLGTYKAKDASPKLIELYTKSKTPQNAQIAPETKILQSYLRLEIIKTLGAIQDSANLVFLINQYTSASDCELRLTIMKAIARTGSDEASASFLKTMLDDEFAGFHASVALARMGDSSVLPVLINGILTNKETSEYITKEIFSPLGEPATDELIKLLDYPFEAIAAQAAFTLAQMKVERAKSKIISLYKNKELVFDSAEAKIMDALLLIGEDPFYTYFEKHEFDLNPTNPENIPELTEKSSAVKMLDSYLRPNAKSSDVLIAIAFLSKLKTPEARKLLTNYIPPDDPRVKEAHKNALLCPE